MATSWSTFFPYIQPHVPGCPEMTIELHLQEAAVDFCERSSAWRVDFDDGFTVRGISDYEVGVPNRTLLENVLHLSVDGRPLRKAADTHTFTNASGEPDAFSIYQDTMVRFYPTPDGKYAFKATGVLKPSLGATGVEDFLYNTHGRAIAFGALGKLLNIPGKEWTNPELAAYYNARAAKAADNAKGRDMARGEMRVATRKFA